MPKTKTPTPTARFEPEHRANGLTYVRAMCGDKCSGEFSLPTSEWKRIERALPQAGQAAAAADAEGQEDDTQ